jgi:PKD repeat protein
MVYKPMPAVVGQPTTFTISASVPNGTIDHSIIDFGDGSTVPLTGNFTSIVDHTYKAAGDITAGLTATTKSGKYARMTVNLTVIPPDR